MTSSSITHDSTNVISITDVNVPGGETSLDNGDRHVNAGVFSLSRDQELQISRNAPIKYCTEPEYYLSEAHKLYAPKDVQESKEGYEVRAARAESSFEPFYEHLRNLIVGTALRKGIEYEASSEWGDFFDNVDLEGSSLTSFVKAAFTQSLDGGVAGLWADYPDVPEGLTAGEEKRAAYRPWLVAIPCEDVLEVRSEVKTIAVGGQTFFARFPVYLRLKADFEEPNSTNEFDLKKYNAVKVYDVVTVDNEERVRWRLFVERVENNPQMESEGFLSIPAIPFVPLYGGRIEGYFKARPQLLDIARLNMHHWVIASDLAFKIHNTGRDYLYGVGMDPDEDPLQLEADRVMYSRNADAKFGILSPQMNGAEVTLENLGRIERSMERLAAVAMTTSKTQAESGFSKLLDRAQSDSQLAILVQELEDSLVTVLAYVAAYKDAPPAKIKISKDFIPVKLHSQQVMSYLQMWKDTPTPIRLLLEMFKAGELYENILTPEGRPVSVDSILESVGLKGDETALELGYAAPVMGEKTGPDAGVNVDIADPGEVVEAATEVAESAQAE